MVFKTVIDSATRAILSNSFNFKSKHRKGKLPSWDNPKRNRFFKETWLNYFMSQRVKDSIIANYKQRLNPKQFIDGHTVETSDNHFLVDYTAISHTPLRLHKDRFLLLEDGSYFEYGFVGAKNIQNNLKYAIMVKGTQLKESDLIMLQLMIEDSLGKKIIMVTDNQHKHSIITAKETTMWLECEFGGVKQHGFYKSLKQCYKNGFVVTSIDSDKFLKRYVKRMSESGFIILRMIDFKPTAKKQLGA